MLLVPLPLMKGSYWEELVVGELRDFEESRV